MKKFLTKIFTLLTSLLLLFLLLDTYVFPNNKNQMFSKYNLLNNANGVEVLVLGNSHTFFGINPQKSEFKMLNLANKGRKIETDYYILKNNIDKIKDVKLVIVPVSHCKMHAVSLGEKEKRLYYNYFKVQEYKQSFLKNSLLLNEPFRELVNNSIFKNKDINDFGWRASKSIYKKDIEAIKERLSMSEDESYVNGTINCSNVYLEKMNKLCKRYNKKMVLLIPPYHPDFYKYGNKLYQKQSALQLKNMAIKNNMIFVNGRELKIVKDSLFENSDHLNIYGADVFTRKLDSILKKEK